MRKAWVIALAAGCGNGVSSFEEAADEQLTVQREFARILEGVKDKATADAAKPLIEALGVRVDEIAKTVKALGEPTPEESQRVIEKMRTGIAEINERMKVIVARLDAGSHEIAESIQEPSASFMQKCKAVCEMLGG